MSKAKVGNSQILILDVEGSDSHDRADDRERSQKALALLALVMSDVLIINTDTMKVNSRNGGNLALLEIIF